MSDTLDSFKNRAYTGANRCLPCTAVNVVLAALLGGVLGALAPPIGAAAFVLGLGSIYFRGYLVPGTPELTKRYFPDWLLAKFDKVDEPPVRGPGPVRAGGADADSDVDGADDATADESDAEVADPVDDGAVERARDAAGGEGIVDPETLLVNLDVVEACADRDDLCLTDAFADEWTANAAQLRDDADAQLAAIAELFDLEGVALERDEDDRLVASADDDRFNAWVTEGALLADLAAASVIADRTDWAAILPAQRVAILRALRSFLDVCPTCGGAVGLTEDTVDSCCRSWDVLAVRCADCDTHFLELDPDRLGGSTAASADTDAAAHPGDGEASKDSVAADSRGPAESVDPGFTRG